LGVFAISAGSGLICPVLQCTQLAQKSAFLAKIAKIVKNDTFGQNG